MSKVLVSCIIKQNEKIIKSEQLGILNKGVLQFITSYQKTKYNLNFDKDELIRENEQFKMVYSFDKKKESYYYLKEINKKLIIPLEIKKIKKTSMSYLVEYVIEGQSDLISFEVDVKENSNEATN